MDEDTEKLVITSADGRTNQRCLGVGGPAAPPTRAASRSGPGAPGPVLTVNVRGGPAASPLPPRACADCLLWPKLDTQRSNLTRLTHESTTVHPLAWHPYIHILCVCLSVCLPAPCGTQDVSSRPGMEPVPAAMDVQRANHWTTRECQCAPLFNHN